MEKIFYPESVAVIGVSERPDNLASCIIRNMLAFGYQGDIHAVGLRAGKIHGIPILTSVETLPKDVDLAVILTPAATVPGVLDACGRQGIRRAVIESGGFAEFSAEGRRLEEEVCDVARRWDLRFVGPNCISVINMDNGLCLPFARLDRRAAKRGPVSVLAQSGGVSVTYMMLLNQAGLGASKVVSMGNKADLDEVDYLTYLLGDPGTSVICLYLESIEQGRRLLELAASSDKPIIVQKSNQSDASVDIAFSHTAALANDDRIVSAAFRQAGVARAGSFDEAVSLAQGFTLPPVTGNDLLIVSRSGGHAVVAADAAAAHGFRLIPVPEAFRAEVRHLFRADVIAPTNPLDLGTIFDFHLYSHIVERSLRALGPHALLLVHTYSPGPEAEASRQLVQRVGELGRDLGKPLAFCAFAQQSDLETLSSEATLPIFTDIEGAVRALAASRDRYACPARLAPLPRPSMRRTAEVEALLGGARTLSATAALDLCRAFDIPVAPWAEVEDIEAASVAADVIGYPVALKGLVAEVSHKSDAGLVALGIRDGGGLRAAFSEVWSAMARCTPHALERRMMVQKMVPHGFEVIIGGKRDPSFGPVVMFGLGGIYVEILDDVAVRLVPLAREHAEQMINEVRGSRILRGLRGQPAVDRGAIVESLLAMSQLLVECPEVLEIDVNPLLVFARGAAAVDARVIVENQIT